MARTAVLALMLAALLPPIAPAAGEARYSGHIAAAGATEITLEELGPWTPGSHPITRVIELAPATRIERVARSTRAAQWPGGFEATALAARDLRAGEFATVTVEHRDGRLVARSITVVEAR
jgi:hypothetical protein